MAEPRRNIGPSHWGAKLTAAQIVEIRQRLANGESIRSVARAYGVSAPHIQRIGRGESRKKG